jgi:hypothetical protein
MATNTTDYASVALKLLEKTKAGKVGWEQSSSFGSVNFGDPVYEGSELFRADLTEGFKFEVSRTKSRGDTTYSLTMRDDNGTDVFTLSLTDDPEIMFNQKPLYEALGDLFDAARRRALKVDQKVERVSEILERI